MKLETVFHLIFILKSLNEFSSIVTSTYTNSGFIAKLHFTPVINRPIPGFFGTSQSGLFVQQYQIGHRLDFAKAFNLCKSIHRFNPAALNLLRKITFDTLALDIFFHPIFIYLVVFHFIFLYIFDKVRSWIADFAPVFFGTS